MGENGQDSNLSARQEKAILALLSEPTFVAAAEAAGVGSSTLDRWFREDANFVRAFHSARKMAFQAAVFRLQVYSLDAVEVLRDIMTDPKTAATPRVHAADSIIEYAAKATEIEEVAMQLRQIKNMLAQAEGG